MINYLIDKVTIEIVDKAIIIKVFAGDDIVYEDLRLSDTKIDNE